MSGGPHSAVPEITQTTFDCQHMWKDQSDQKATRALFVLAGINFLVILQGVYTFRIRLQNDPYRMRTKIYMFLILALSCLCVAEIYFIIGSF